MSATLELVSRVALAWMNKRPFSKESRARRKAKRAARKGGEPVDETSEVFNEVEESTMDVQGFVVQSIMAAIRHGLTAGGLVGIVGSDQSMAQIAGVVALVVGGAWSLWRKWAAAKKPA
jgi:hypothetical protein